MWEQQAVRILKTAGLAETTGSGIYRLLRNEYYKKQSQKLKNSRPLKKPRRKH
jgi:hypothetical protein